MQYALYRKLKKTIIVKQVRSYYIGYSSYN